MGARDLSYLVKLGRLPGHYGHAVAIAPCSCAFVHLSQKALNLRVVHA